MKKKMYKIELTHDEFQYVAGLLEQESEGLNKYKTDECEFKDEFKLIETISGKMNKAAKTKRGKTWQR